MDATRTIRPAPGGQAITHPATPDSHPAADLFPARLEKALAETAKLQVVQGGRSR
jgi:hypothetical protein